MVKIIISAEKRALTWPHLRSRARSGRRFYAEPEFLLIALAHGAKLSSVPYCLALGPIGLHRFDLAALSPEFVATLEVEITSPLL